jgi:recombination protein RecA
MTKMKDLLQNVAKQYKDESIATMGAKIKDPDRLSTGLFAFDIATGGGIPEGRCTILYGTEDSMKTSICLKLIAQAQKKYPNKSAVFVDIEGVFSRDWARTLGVDVDKLVYIHPDNAEQMVDIVEGILYTEDASLVVVDSLAALLTTHESEKSAEDAIVGRTGLVINKFYRKMSMALGKARRQGRNPSVLCINQIRFKIGVTHGNPETMPGGPAFKYASSMTIRLYGKDIMESAVSKSLPAYKEMSMIIQKHKVPILAKKGILQVALMPIPEYGLEIGQAYDWNTLLAYLKSMELMVKDKKKGWLFTNPATGEQTAYKVIDELKTKVYADPDFGAEVKAGLIALMMTTDEVIE